MHNTFLALTLLALSAVASGQDAEDEWDVTRARGDSYQLDFETDEGTFMSVDVARDGSFIVFDLLAHVYRVSTSGGVADCLTCDSGVAVNFHPRISPSGESIAFVSDRGGQNNLWLMDADGANPRPVLDDLDVRVASPAWTPDGDYLVVERQTTTRQRSSGVWMYHREGGSGIELLGSDVRRASWPSVSDDGRYLYYQFAPSANRDLIRGAFALSRLDLQTGDIAEVVSGEAQQQYQGSSGGAIAPEVSPDGKWLAFARRIPFGTISFKGHQFGPRTALWLRDLETGAERILVDPIETDMAEGMKTLRVLPAYAWSSDARSIFLSRGGKLWRIDVATGEETAIPFTARVTRPVSEMAYGEISVSAPDFDVRFVRWPAVSPDGSKLVFHAAGKIWIMDRPNGSPTRLTPDSFEPYELAPVFSPDGSTIVFTTWDDSEGYVWSVPSSGGAPDKLTERSAEYIHPVFSPDGESIVVARGSGATARGRSWSNNLWYDLVSLPSSGGEASVVIRTKRPYGGGRPLMPRRQIVIPSFGPDGRLFYPEQSGVPVDGRTVERTELISVELDGSDKRVHMTFPYADEAVPSPDGKWVAFAEGDNVYLTPLPWPGTGGEPPSIDRKKSVLPVTQVSTTGGFYLRFRNDSTLDYGSADKQYAYDLSSGTTNETTIRLSLPRARASGSVAFTGARILTMNDGAVIDSGALVLEDGMIRCVGECSTAGVDRVIDAGGKTLIPGLIDMHAHHHRDHTGILPPHNWESAVYMAYGVTTTLDNSQWSQNVFSAAELVEAGRMIGPRTFSTGDPLYNGDGARQNDITSYEVAEQNVERLESWGAISIKSYMQPRRAQRQWIADAARKRGLKVTGEGGDLAYNISLMLDGQTGWEHPMSYAPLYADAAKFFGKTKAMYSVTFVVGGPSAWNEEYFWQESEIGKDPKQQRFLPWRMLVPHTRRRPQRPLTDYSFPMIAQGLADVIEEGGYGAIGSHGQHHGLGSHWEIWMAESALGPMGALDIATRQGAYFLGLEKELGSLEVGKLGDVLVLNSNPLDDIRNTTDIQYVVKDGVVYEAETLDEVWPEAKPYGEYPWLLDGIFQTDDRPIRE